VTLKTFKFLYLAFWCAVAAAAVILATSSGRPWWHGGVAAYIVFWFCNGTIAYVHRARRQRREGEVPQPYLSYLLFGSRGHEPVPRALRTVVGLAAMALGLPLFAVGCIFGIVMLGDGVPTGPGAAGTMVMMILLPGGLLSAGGVLSYIGFRFIVGKDDETLMRRRRGQIS
jgi:hypothetical protein